MTTSAAAVHGPLNLSLLLVDAFASASEPDYSADLLAAVDERNTEDTTISGAVCFNMKSCTSGIRMQFKEVHMLGPPERQ